MQYISCPICDSTAKLWRSIRGYPILDCSWCGHRFADARKAHSHVANVYSDEYFFGGGAGYVNYPAQASLLQKRGQGYARLVSKYCTPRQGTALRVVDVGAAGGYLLQGWLDCGWTGFGIEPNESMVAVARKQSLDVRHGAFESMEIAEREWADCVAMVQVVAHFIDPVVALRRAWELLCPGGVLLVETWDRESWTARCLGTRWHEYSPPSVLHWFSRKTLTNAVKQVGFRELKSSRVRRWLKAKHAKSLLAHSTQDTGWVGRSLRAIVNAIPDRFEVPYPGDDLFYSLFRKPEWKEKTAMAKMRQPVLSEQCLAGANAAGCSTPIHETRE